MSSNNITFFQEYNGDPNYETNKIICHRARALQDFAYALVKAEMVRKILWNLSILKVTTVGIRLSDRSGNPNGQNMSSNWMVR